MVSCCGTVCGTFRNTHLNVSIRVHTFCLHMTLKAKILRMTGHATFGCKITTIEIPRLRKLPTALCIRDCVGFDPNLFGDCGPC